MSFGTQLMAPEKYDPADSSGVGSDGLMCRLPLEMNCGFDEVLFASQLTQDDARTLPIGIRLFTSAHSEQYAQLLAAGVVSTLPIMVAFFATQRWLVKGLTAGAVKG